MILLVIDTQKGIMDEGLFAFEKVRDNISRLIEEARGSGIEVIFVRHDDGEGSGFSKGDEAFEIYGGFSPLPGEKIFDKNVNSALNPSVGLFQHLKDRNVKKIITVGLQTDYCVDATVKSGFDLGFDMIVPSYCNSTRDNAYMSAEATYRFYNENMWPGRYAACISVDEAVRMMKDFRKEDLPVSRCINACGSLDIDTGRLLLRKFTYDDIPSMMRNWVSDDDVQNKYGEPSYKTEEEVRGLLDRYIGGYSDGTYFRWAVIEKESGECIGQTAFFLVNAACCFGEIEYCIGRQFQGKGYATEAAKAVTKFGFDRIGFHRVQICARPANAPSRKVIGKCGFTYEGTLRDFFLIDGSYEGRMYFSILEDEYRANPF